MNKNAKWAAGPYLVWMVVFVIVPLVLIGVFAFTSEIPYDLDGNRITAERAAELELAYEGEEEEEQ